MMDKQEFMEYLEEEYKCQVKLWNCDSSDRLQIGKVNLLKEIIDKAKGLDEPEKPEIPKFVADWIEEVKQRGCGLADALNCFVSPIMPEKVKQWVQFDFAAIGCHHDNQELLAKAWLNGYTIEKEPVWVVKEKESGGYLVDYKLSDNDVILSSSKANAYPFKDKQQAESVATLTNNTIEERNE